MKYIQQYSYFFMLSIVLSCIALIGLYIDDRTSGEKKEEQFNPVVPTLVQQEQLIWDKEIAYYKKETRKEGERK
ncbi:hypothetical protein IRY55_01485 [Savagea sp. SN6]|uniref:Uncharacterized protein n=1 Tax=Savagea serpentis TaxID=2785297 RepID=A0A8J7KRY8_9BACL|nr:hypothetical protein [Savagea serpentis]MBF4500019.1 hypothetical protein [Savagea serpentis]